MQQRRSLAFKATGSKSTAEQASLQEKRNSLAHRITNWQKIQDIYMPLVTTLRPSKVPVEPDQDQSEPQNPTDTRLFLPSGCQSSMWESEYFKVLLSKEAQLRLSQAYDALAYIRKFRRIFVSLVDSRHQNVSGTGNRANTRLRSLLNKFQNRIKLAALRYRAAYAALCLIDPNGSWKTELKPLHDADIRGPGRDPDDDVLGEGRREISWIWLVAGPTELSADNSDKDVQEVMRVEWAKTKARAQRWSEEVALLQEEMRRVLEYCDWKATWWRNEGGQRTRVDDLVIVSGLKAYAEKQASVFDRLGQSFASRWSSVLKKHRIKASWQAKYEKLPAITSLWKLADFTDRPDGEEESDHQNSDDESDIEMREGEENQGNDIEMEM